MNDNYFGKWFSEEQVVFRELQLSLLHLIYERKNMLVFKGGTALDLFYGSNRFSEDLDFDCADTDDLATIDDALESLEGKSVYKIYNDWERNRELHSHFTRYNIRVSSERWEKVVNFTIDYTIDKPKYAYVPMPMKYNGSIDSINVMQAKEILAEKVSAIMSRSKARDLYDLYYLAIVKKVPISLKDIYEKCQKVFPKPKNYSYTSFKNSVNNLRGKWAELDVLLENPKVYPFKEVSESVLDAFRSL
jgi:predicted nucleotidyltransferase component of viral defense system